MRWVSMAVNYVVAATNSVPATKPQSKPKRVRAALPPVNLSLPGRLRVDDVLAVLRVGRTWFWRGVKSGLYPQPDFHEGRIPYWRTATILPLVESGGEGGK